ncbi:MAG: XdhC family protein [Gemmatimonadaceae bacterium]
MSEVLEQFSRVAASGRPAALATLVAAAGATPKKAGSTMWVAEDGSPLGSVTIGGCVDARVIEQARAVIASGVPSLLRMSLGDEEAWELGLTCGGRVDVLVQRVNGGDTSDASAAAYRAARATYENGGASVVVAHLDARRERLAIDEEGATVGTLGMPWLDERAREIAAKRLAVGMSSGIEQFTHDGTELSLFFEHLAPPETVVIYGASQVAMSVALFARELGMRTVIVDGREKMANRERFPTADAIHVGMPSELAQQIRATRRTYVVLLAHDYKYDLPVLREVLCSDAGYIGMIGSRRRGASIRAMLEEEGFTTAHVARLRTPIGLSIGAKSAAEIALAIVAEIIAVRQRAAGALPMTQPSAIAASP